MKIWRFNYSKDSEESIVNNLSGLSHLHLVAASTIVAANRDSNLTLILEEGNVICDSRPLNWILKYFNISTPHIRGTDFMRAVLNSNISRNHVFIGSSPENLKKIENIFNHNYPNQNFFSSLSPKFGFNLNEILDYVDTFHEEENLVYWIALGSPLQDYIASKVFERTHKNTIAIGAAVDFFTGTLREAPKILRNHGWEWLYRLYLEPKRLWKRYVIGNFIFVGIVIYQFVHYHFSRGE